ncbi:PEHE domain-containing protein [Phthorimaea operculella]|nr:PEHE domain-containing protein [Phthorimaea operculella]
MAGGGKGAWSPENLKRTSRQTEKRSSVYGAPSLAYFYPTASKKVMFFTRSKRGRPPLSRKIREREREERDESSTSHERRGPGRPSTESRRRQSYDIDNIVIPQSVAASTRPMILTYKEIITPKWRVLDLPEVPLNNGVTKPNRISLEESEEEDISDAAVWARHQRAETREKSRYVRAGRSRRNTAHAHNAEAQGLTRILWLAYKYSKESPQKAHNQQWTVTKPEPYLFQSVRPYTPRQFPLRDDTYMSMLSAMPAHHRLSIQSSPDPEHEAFKEQDIDVDVDMEEPDVDNSSTLSPLSPTTPFDGDDPDDIEWDPKVEKVEKRKNNTFR